MVEFILGLLLVVGGCLAFGEFLLRLLMATVEIDEEEDGSEDLSDDEPHQSATATP